MTRGNVDEELRWMEELESSLRRVILHCDLPEAVAIEMRSQLAHIQGRINTFVLSEARR